MSKTITLTEHRPADGLLTMRVKTQLTTSTSFSIRMQRAHWILKCEKSSKKKRKLAIFKFAAAS